MNRTERPTERQAGRLHLISSMSAAGIHRIPELVILEWAAAGKVPSTRRKGVIYLDRDALEQFIRRRSTGAAGEGADA